MSLPLPPRAIYMVFEGLVQMLVSDNSNYYSVDADVSSLERSFQTAPKVENTTRLAGSRAFKKLDIYQMVAAMSVSLSTRSTKSSANANNRIVKSTSSLILY